jgi:hypothetical protein
VNPRILVFTPDGEYLTEFGGPGSPVQLPGDVVLDGQGNLYVTDGSQDRLVKLRLPESLATPAP